MKVFKRVPRGVVAFAIMLAVAIAGFTNGAKAATATIGPFSGWGSVFITGAIVDPSFPFPADDAFAFHLNKTAEVSGNFNFSANSSFAVTLNIDLRSGPTTLAHAVATDQLTIPNPFGSPFIIPAQPGLFSLQLTPGDYLLAFSGNYGSFSGTLSFAQAPIPAALPLLATALGALGFAGWRRKRGQASMKVWLPLIVLALSVVPGLAHAGCTSYTDVLGMTRVNCDGGSGSLYTDSLGITRGSLGGQSVYSTTDSLGITRGSIGGQPYHSSTDALGITRGTVGGQPFHSSTDALGITRGSIGGQSFTCRTDAIGTTRCY